DGPRGRCRAGRRAAPGRRAARRAPWPRADPAAHIGLRSAANRPLRSPCFLVDARDSSAVGVANRRAAPGPSAKRGPRMRVSSALVTLALVGGTALRAWNLWHPFVRGELEEMIVGGALVSIVRHDWRAPSLHHGSGFVDAVHALFFGWYGTGRLTG